METKDNWGGARKGSGRKPRQRKDRDKVPRQLSLDAALWEEIDQAQEDLGLTRTSIFEKMAREWLDKNAKAGEQ